MEQLEVSLVGALSFRRGDRELGDRSFGAQQLRLVAAMLVLERAVPLATDRLAGAIWPDGAPEQWRPAVRGLVSQLRHLLVELGLERSAVEGGTGFYQLVVDDVVVDVESTTGDLEAAAQHLAVGDAAEAAAAAGRVRAITSRPFLPGVDTTWADDVRARLDGQHLEALRDLGVARSHLGHHDQARQVLRQALRRDPLREDLWRALMRVEVAAGNVASALACYEECRELLAAELGVDPSTKTKAMHGDLLAQSPDDPLPSQHPVGHRGEAGDIRPYVGLRPFSPDDAAVFFGREAEVDEVLTRLTRRGVIAIVGPSGSGKSSLVGGGLVPSLAHGAIPDSDTWALVSVVPGGQPVANLASALADLAGAPPRDRLMAGLTGPDGLHAIAQEVVGHLGDTARLVVVVDQFEELFTLGDAGEAARFVETVLAAARRLDGLTHVVLVLRSDFYDEAVRLPELADVLSTSQFALAPMQAEQVEVVVKGPAVRAGVTLEPGLLARIVADVVDAPGSLPMLQHLLLELWERRVAGVLTRGAYADLGGVAGALARRAEFVYRALAPDRRVLARRVLLRGIRPGEDGVPARRPIVLAELPDLADPAHDTDDVRAVVDHLVASRLLVATGGVGQVDAVELAHEALIGAWPRLGRWVDEARSWMLDHRRLAAVAAEWERHDRHADFLLTGLPLDQARRLRTAAGQGEVELRMTQRERDLLAESLRVRERKHGDQRRRTRTDEIRRMLALSSAATHDDPPLALLTAVEAAGRWDPSDGLPVHEIDAALHSAVQAQRLLYEHADVGTFLTLDPTGSTFLAVAGDPATVPTGRLELRDVASGEVMARFTGHDRRPVSAVFLPDGDRFITAGPGSSLRMWDVDTGDELDRFVAPDGATNLVLGDVDPDGTLVAACHEAIQHHGGRTLVWDLESGGLVADLPRLEASARGLDVGPAGATFSPDGSLLAIIPWAGPTITQVVSVRDWTERYRVGGGKFHAAAAWSPDAAWLAVAGDQVAIVDAATGAVARRWETPVDAVGSGGLAWDARSERLFIGARDIEVWNISAGRRLTTLRAGGAWNRLHAVEVTPDGERLVTGPPDGTAVRVWDVSHRAGVEVAAVSSHPVAVFGLDPTGRRVAVPAAPGTVEVWDVESSPCLVATHTVQDEELHELLWSPDGTRIAAVSESELRVWNPRATEDVFQIPLNHGWVAAFSPDGSLMALSDIAEKREGDPEYVVRILDRDGITVTTLQSPMDVEAYSLAFSSDGSRLAVGRMGGEWPMFPRDFGVDIWAVSTATMATTLPAQAMVVAFLPDQDRLVVGSRTGRIETWDVADEALVHTAEVVGRSAVTALAISPDGGLAAAGNDVGSLDLWELTTGRHLLELPTGSPNPVFDVAFSPHGRHVFAGQLLAGVRAWTLDHDELLAITRSRRSRDFTPQERQRILGDAGGTSC